MGKGLRTAGVVVLALLLLVLVLTLVGRLSGGSSPFTRTLQELTAPVQAAVDGGVRELEQLFSYMHGYDALEAENAALRARIAEMEEAVRRSQSAIAENDELRTLLGFQRSHTDLTLLDARLTSWSPSSYSASFSLDRGSRDGAVVGSPVITAEGFLVGIVTEAGLHTAEVRTILDPQAAVGVSLQSSGLTAVAEGEFTLMREGRCRLSYVIPGASLEAGDTVLTSGDGGLYPAGLVLGAIERVEEDRGYGEYGVITPAADLKRLVQVYLVLGFGGEDES